MARPIPPQLADPHGSGGSGTATDPQAVAVCDDHVAVVVATDTMIEAGDPCNRCADTVGCGATPLRCVSSPDLGALDLIHRAARTPQSSYADDLATLSISSNAVCIQSA